MTSLKRTLLSLLIVLTIATAFASVAGASPTRASHVQSAPHPQRANSPCVSPQWIIESNSGWVNTGYNNVYLYAQVWIDWDGNYNIWCGDIRSKAGIWFRATYEVCDKWDQRLYVNLGGGINNLTLANEDVEGLYCGVNGSSYQFWGTPVGGFGYNEICDPVQAMTYDETSNIYTWAYWDCFD